MRMKVSEFVEIYLTFIVINYYCQQHNILHQRLYYYKKKFFLIKIQLLIYSKLIFLF